ncbi:MAG: hypothetical protein AAF471_04015 [Myxococcota bacterium]
MGFAKSHGDCSSTVPQWIRRFRRLPKCRDAINRDSTTAECTKTDSRLRGLPKSPAGCFSKGKPTECPKMDSCFRRNDRVGKSASNLGENESSTKERTLSLSFLRKQESTEKTLDNDFADFLEGPFRRNDRVDKPASKLDKNEQPTKNSTIILSFPRKRESMEKQGRNESTDFLEGPFRRNDKVGSTVSQVDENESSTKNIHFVCHSREGGNSL